MVLPPMTKADTDAQLEITAAIYEFVLDADAANVAIDKLCELLSCNKAMMVRLADDRRRDIVLASHGFERDTMNAILRDRENSESFLARTDRWHAGGIASDNDYCDKQPPGEARKPSSLYPESLQLTGIDHTLLGVVDTSEIHHIVMWFHRDAKTGPFSKADTGVFSALMPHWQRACKLKLSYDLRDSAVAASAQVLDQSPFGLFLLGRDAQIVFSNAAAKKQCSEGAGIRLRNQSLVFSDRDIRAAYEKMLAATMHGSSEGDPRMAPISFNKTNGVGSYQIGMRRLSMPAKRGSLATRKVIALFIYDTSERMDLSIDNLKALYGLTDAEARVCDLLYQSRNLPEAAAVLKISINTAKTHLTRSFRKVGVQSQAELIRRLNSQLYVS
jgi:DNA-binding CsgD family transcriptional regulator